MEAIVTIIEVGAYSERQYQRQGGAPEYFKSRGVLMKRGGDTFFGEINGERAVNCPKFDLTKQYRVLCTMITREWLSQQTGEQMQANTIYVDKINMV